MMPTASTTSPEAEGGNVSRPNSSPPGRVAFLVHSVETFTHSLPPEVDDKSLARQRRRRTSPEDQKILEDEFHKNPRPDKAGRRAIVSRVSLGDKEVQIWFQNRRQNSRRKQRQDQPDIIVLSSDAAEESEVSSSQSEQCQDKPPKRPEVKQSAEASTALATEPATEAIPVDDDKETQSTHSTSIESSLQSSAPKPVETQQTDITSSQVSDSNTSSQTTKFGYLANRRIASYIEEPLHIPTMTSFAASNDFRLSMTDDGKAKIVNRAKPSPSPERPKSIAVEAAMASRLGSLRRSYSAAGLDSSNPPPPAQPTRKVPRTSTLGRSRDSRTWEFWCDSDARNSLIERADQENSGSAAEAIGLMRSNSSRALRINSNKVNSPILGQSRSKQSRPALQRSSTHAGFVHTKQGPATDQPKKPSKKSSETDEYEQLQTESDKENCDPDDARPSNRSQLTVARSKKVLGENTSVMSHSSSFGHMMARGRSEKSSRTNKATTEIHVDAEVAGFMGESKESNGDDLDCVQSLLSLSQGNWR